MIKSNTLLKRWFWVEENKALKIFKTFENEDFFCLTKIFQYIFFWNFELRWFQICIQIFHKFVPSKVGIQSGPILLVFARFCPFLAYLKVCNFWLKKNMKNLNTYLKSARFKASEKCKLKNLHFFHFFLLRVSSSFSNFWKFLKLGFSHFEWSFKRGTSLNCIFFIFKSN